jgi:hypothetical protein
MLIYFYKKYINNRAATIGVYTVFMELNQRLLFFTYAVFALGQQIKGRRYTTSEIVCMPCPSVHFTQKHKRLVTVNIAHKTS